VVADGALDEIRAKSGRVRYVVSVDEKHALEGKAPKAAEVEEALKKIANVQSVSELPTDDRAHAYELAGDKDGDIRSEIYKLAVQKGWILLELRRDAQTLGDVFRDLTRGESLHARGLATRDEDEDEDEDETEDEDESSEEEKDDRESDAGDSKAAKDSEDKKD